MNILVTGGAGFVGSHLVDALIKSGHRVAVVDNLSRGDKENVHQSARLYIEDITDNLAIAKIFKREKPEIVFHLAAQLDNQFSAKNPTEDAKINILGGLNVFQNCVDVGVKKVIFFSSAAVYGNTKKIPTGEQDELKPIYPYGIAKLALEKYLGFYQEIYGLDYTIFRPSNIYGPRQKMIGDGGVVAIFTQKMLRGEAVKINGDGKQTRDFIYINDVVSACIKSIKDKKSQIYNLATKKETNINLLFEKINNLTGDIGSKEFYPLPKGEQRKSVLKNGQVKRGLKWKQEVDIDTGLEKTVNWLRENL